MVVMAGWPLGGWPALWLVPFVPTGELCEPSTSGIVILGLSDADYCKISARAAESGCLGTAFGPDSSISGLLTAFDSQVMTRSCQNRLRKRNGKDDPDPRCRGPVVIP